MPTDVRVVLDDEALREFFQSADGPVARHLLSLAAQIERLAKLYCPVDTGRLRASIATLLVQGDAGLEAWVGTNVEYAIFVEFGTWKMEPRSFLRRALAEVVGP